MFGRKFRILAVTAVLATATSTQAAPIIFELSMEFSGAQTPVGAGPFLRATFVDVTGGVELKMESMLNSATEFVSNWYFNLDPALNPNLLDFDLSSGGPAASSITTGVNAFQADGDGLYDVRFRFSNSGPSRFNNADIVTYLITSTETISAASFNFMSAPAGNHGPFPTAAHVQGINDSGSGWITVPEPTSGLLMMAALTGLIAVRRRAA